MSFWPAVFGVTNDITILQECARTALVFAYGLALVRYLGGRVFGRWAALDIIVSIVVGSSLSRALTGAAPLFGTLIAATLLMALHACAAWAATRWRALSLLLEGRAQELLHEGQPNRTLIRRRRVTQTDLDEAARASGLENAGQARAIILEPSRKLSVLKH